MWIYIKSLHPPTRSTVRTNTPRMCGSDETRYQDSEQNHYQLVRPPTVLFIVRRSRQRTFGSPAAQQILSRGEVPKLFATCLEHVKTLESKGLSYHEPEDLDWLGKFYFMVDMTSHLNTRNKNLQGKGNGPADAGGGFGV